MGGLAGHMSHLYDNPRLTFAKIKSILQDAAEGNLEGTEKTDGQNLYISFSVPKQELEFAEGGPKAARNKTNIKSGGMNYKELAAKFSFNKSLQKSFSQALRDFGDVIKKFPRAKQEEIFGPDTNIYYNAEIINPETANVINYDSKLVSIHRGGGAEFDKETGSPIEVEIVDPETGEVITGQKDVSGHAQTLADELDKVQQDLADDRFKIEMDAVFNLKALNDDKTLNRALSEIESEISAEGISDNQMIIEYIMARILSMIKERGLNLDEETEKLLLKRVLLSNKAYRVAYGYDKMPKELDPRKIVKGASPKDKNNAIYIIKNADQILKNAIEPIESTIHDFSVDMLKGLESLFILDNKKETERLRKDVAKAIKAIESSGHEDALEILQKQMNKLKSVENISTAAEGFVFDYDGWSYKFTGNFAPINQILGLFKYGRAGIPPLEKLTEAVDIDVAEKIILYPGRFQPMGLHHKEVYDKLREEFDTDNVYIVTSEKVELPKSPLTFDEKKKIFLKHGIPEDKIISVKNPYNKDELGKHFDGTSTIAIYALGEKDANRLGTNTGYFRKYEDNLNDLKVFDDQGYVTIAPHICINLPGGVEMCGSTIRDVIHKTSPEGLKDLMGWSDDEIYALLRKKIPKRSTRLSEAILSIVEEIINERSSASKDRVSKKISYLIDEEKKDPKQAAAIAYSMEDRGELDESELEEYRIINYGVGPDPDRKPKKKYSEPALKDDYKTDKSEKDTYKDSLESDESEDMELDELSGAGAAGGYSLPLGMSPEYFKSPRPKVKGIKVYTSKRKKT